MKGAGRCAVHHSGCPLGLLLLLLFFCPHLFPKDKAKKEPTPEQKSTFSVKVNAVVIRAAATDKSGNPINDLAKGDFRVYDDGKPQEIQTFARESMDPAESEETKFPDTLSSPKSGRESMVRPPRLISIVIDDLTMEPPSETGSILDFPRMVDAVKRFVKTDLGPTDQVTILSGSRNVQFPFTDSRQRLLEESNRAYARLKADPAAWEEELRERGLWESTLGDGVEPE